MFSCLQRIQEKSPWQLYTLEVSQSVRWTSGGFRRGRSWAPLRWLTSVRGLSMLNTSCSSESQDVDYHCISYRPARVAQSDGIVVCTHPILVVVNVASHDGGRDLLHGPVESQLSWNRLASFSRRTWIVCSNSDCILTHSSMKISICRLCCFSSSLMTWLYPCRCPRQGGSDLTHPYSLE